MKYSAYIEPYGFRQFQNLVTETESLLTSERKRIDEKKQKLFKKGYSQEWRISEEVQFDQSKVGIQDYAFKYMLSDESEKIHKLEEELQFFTE